MKQITYAIAISVAMVMSVFTYAQNVQLTGATFSPLPITDCQNTTANINIIKFCTNAALDSIRTDINTGTDTAEIYVYYSLGPICLGAIANVTDNTGMGNIPANTSSVHVNLYLNQSVVDDAYYPISVSQCCAVVANFNRSSSVVCPGDTVFLSNTSQLANSYKWYVGSTLVSTATDFDTVFTTPGSYTVSLVSNSSTCGDSTSKFVTVVDASFSAGPDTTVCLDGSFSLDAGIGLDSVIWSTGARGRFWPVTQSGTIVVRAYRGGCEAFDTVVISGLSMPVVDLGMDTTICIGDTLTLDASNSNNMSYLWQDNSTASDFMVTMAGVYYVTVTSADGCVITDSITVQQDSCSGIGMDEISSNAMRLYPNPAKNYVELECADFEGAAVLQVIDAMGRTVIQSDVQFANGRATLSLGDIPSGAYFVRLRADERVLVESLMVE